MTKTRTLDLKALSENKKIDARNYWKKQLSDFNFRMYFNNSDTPIKYPEPTAFSLVSFEGTKKLFSDLNHVAQSGKAKHIVLLSALIVCAHKYSSVDDIVILTPRYGSDKGQGPNDKLLPIRINDFSTSSFHDLIMKVKKTIFLGLKQKNYPIDKMLKDSGSNGQNYKLTSMLLEEVQCISEFEHSLSGLLFSFSTTHGLSLKLKYKSEIFDSKFIGLLPELYFELLQKLIKYPKKPIDQVELISDKEKNKILHRFNQTDHSYPREQTVVELFQQVVKKNPHQVALEYNGVPTSFGELNNKANQLYYLLQKHELNDRKPIAIMLERSTDFIVAVLGVLKSGLMYLPLDLNYPQERINYIIDNSQCSLVITKKSILTSIGLQIPAQVVCIEKSHPIILGNPIQDPLLKKVQNIYVIYTSGSTKYPKGVIGTQVGLLNRLFWEWDKYPYSENDKCCQKTNLGFVDHVTEIFSPLLKGIPLFILKEDEVLNADIMIDRIVAKRITRITLVPSLLQALITVKKRKKLSVDVLRHVVCSGESLPYHLAEQFRVEFKGARLLNIYGSTEVSADVTCNEVHALPWEKENGKILIGKPIYNTKIHIVDQRNKLVPPGVIGEILISGDAVSSGYFNEAELWTKSILNKSFQDGSATYKSGDLGRWLPDGNIEYFGRKDYQVKVRGVRIKLGEIETALMAHDRIRRVVVVLRGEEDDTYLVAYYVSDHEIKISEIRSFLARTLPKYMIPSYFVYMVKIPLTISGKTDRKSLPDQQIKAGEDYAAPTNEIEVKLVEIWSNVLKIDKQAISVNASFFELGGHSLRALALVNKIQGDLRKDISVKDVFERKNIASLARLLKISKKYEFPPLVKTKVKPYYNLSIAQQRVYYFYKFDKTSLTYNMPMVAKLQGRLDKNKLKEVFTKLILRHESFRTSFRTIDEQSVQLIMEEFEFDIEYFGKQDGSVNEIIEKFVRPFDLNNAPLFRIGIIELGPKEHYLMTDMHHIISDGTSIGILINDFSALYHDTELPPIQLTYKDYAEWQQSEGYQKKIAAQKDFWLKEFSEPLTPLDIPMDYSGIPSTEGDSVNFHLNKEETRELRKIAETEVATISMLILSVLKVMLSKISNQEDIVVGITVAGREQLELENMIGMFPVVLPLRSHLGPELSFRSFLAELRMTFLGTLENQSYQYEELGKDLNLNRNSNRNPWFDVMFLYQNFEKSELVIPELTITPYEEHTVPAYERLNLTINENHEQLFFKLSYAKTLFKKETIERFALFFTRIVRQIIQNIDVSLSDIQIADDDEIKSLLDVSINKRVLNRTKCYFELFQDQALKTPFNIAVEHNNVKLTYDSLWQQSKHMGKYLSAAITGRNENIALLLPRGIDMLTSILATFYAGCAYVPIDADFPEQRIIEILFDSGSKIVIVTSETLPIVEQLQKERKIDSIQEIVIVGKKPKSNPKIKQGLDKSIDDIAYIIYTSGTTGKPKGVMIPQLGMINHLYGMIDVLNLTENDVIAQTAAPCFDISVWQFLTLLLVGGKTCILDKNTIMDPQNLALGLQSGQVTIFQSVPSLISTYLSELDEVQKNGLRQLRWMIPTGEPLTVDLTKKWFSNFPEVPLLNAYGPAEASDDVTVHIVKPPKEGKIAVPIGKAIQNMQVYILDKSLNFCPVGVRGEICVAGLGVGKGYWNDKQKTEESFIENPFIKEIDDSDYQRLYKTGDLGYRQNDGTIVYTGRRDNQIKIRGFRIEIGEIENNLVGHRSIREVTVLFKEQKDQKCLVAYYVSNKEISVDTLKKFLSQKLPGYMIPAYFVHLTQLPLTRNGKIDKRALPNPEIQAGIEHVAPSTEVEKKLAMIWSDVLDMDLEKIGTLMSFFHIGGHSLNTIKLINKISKEFDVSISLKDFFATPNIKFVAGYIEMQTWLNDKSKKDDNVVKRKVII